MSATTPRRTNMTTQHSPSKTPSRRVLGDLAPKAINTPSSQTKAFDTSEVARAQSPLKQAAPTLLPAFGDKENLASPNATSKGKKRGIDEVDSAESVENLKMLARGRDETLSNTGDWLTSAAMQRHTENNPIGLAEPGSPTECNTPSPEPEPLQHSQKSNQSFSDFLNYDQCASQKSEQGVPQALAPAPTFAPAAAAPDDKKSRAEKLRARLKFGLYKVKTNQVGKRDADIISRYEMTASRSSIALGASISTALTSSVESTGSHRVPNITVSSPRRAQGPVFVQASLEPYRPIGKLGPAPVQFQIPQEGLRPSSRMIHGYDLSSSPPQVELPQSISPGQLMSPVRESAYNASSMGASRIGEQDEGDIDAGTETPHERLQRLKEQSWRESGLSDSTKTGGGAQQFLKTTIA